MTDLDDSAGPDTLAMVHYVHHVSFRVDDVADALAFYVGLLGCQPIDRPTLGVPGAWLELGDVQVHLIQVPADATTGAPPSEANPMACHVAFHVDDIDRLRARLRQAGLHPVSGHPALPQCFVQDPSGNVIEFTAADR